MDEIGAHLPRPDRELTAVVRVEALPVLALLRFHDGDHDTAERRLRAALDTCHRLASEYGHRYLTGKQLHFAVNIARCTTARGDLDGAAALLERVAAIAKGTRARRGDRRSDPPRIRAAARWCVRIPLIPGVQHDPGCPDPARFRPDRRGALRRADDR
ncbi:tetratricopeptide repeat protein [Nocardia sp. NPDC051900]|uniref:tetratricopeptide repeat protein n=1 Tax=Nocardia sp. NPDC051900 TaxID=3364326 RepID=UPI0037A3018F